MAPGSPARRVGGVQVPIQRRHPQANSVRRQAAHGSQVDPQLAGLTKALGWLTVESLRSLQVCSRGLLEQTLQGEQVRGPRWFRPRWRRDALQPAAALRRRLLDDVPLCVRATLAPAASGSPADTGSPESLDGWLRPFPGVSDQESSSDYSEVDENYAKGGPFEGRDVDEVEVIDSSDSDVVVIRSTPGII